MHEVWKGRIGLAAQIHDSLEHHERVVQAATERLRAGEQEHQGGVVFLPFLNGPPGQVMKGLEITPGRRRLGLRPAVGRVGAWGGRGRLQKQDEREQQGHVSRKSLV